MNSRRFFIGSAIGILVLIIIGGGIYLFTQQKPIRLSSPLPNALVSSPLNITGEARGNWYFEASFPVFLTDWDGKIIAQGIAKAESDWMTTNFVPFKATLTFNTSDISGQYSNKGTLILKKDNPSGLPQNDDALEIPIQFKGPVACTMEAKICPDGSAVGRTGPNCEFAICPNTTDKNEAVINGSVTLSPVCPVERIPPDPKCAPRPFETDVKVFNTDGNTLIKTIQTSNDGNFTFTLPYGNYVMEAVGGNPYPRCSPTALSIQTPVVNTINLSCDTGIR